MSRYPQYPQQGVQPWGARDAVADRAVFNFFNIVYAWMAVGIAVSAVVGVIFASNRMLLESMYPVGFMVVGLAAFCIAMFVQGQIGRLSVGVATTLFLLYAAMIGAMYSFIFVVYSSQVLLSALAVTGGVFAVMSLMGFIMKRDLSGIGSAAIMLAWGLFFASIVNIFLQNDAFSWLITYAIVIVFVAITAYETQQLKRIAIQFQGQPALAARFAVVGSLILYISFINLFMAILRILGSRR